MASDQIYPAPGTDDSGEHPMILKRILATLAKQNGGEIRLSRLDERCQLAVFRDPATMEYVVRVSEVPWPHRED